MRVLGLTGTIAGGKSTVSTYLETRGFHRIECDKVGHQVLHYPEIFAMLVTEFGEDVARDGSIHRPNLAAKAFSSAESVVRLNAITHPVIKHSVIEEARLHRDTTKVVIDAALLFELNLDDECDACWFIDAPADMRKLRLGLEKESFLQREQYQEPYQPKRDRCQHVLMNEYDLETLHTKVDTLLKETT